MTSPFSGWVLGVAAILTLPALQAAFLDGTMSMQTALIRFGIAALVVWLGVSLLESLMQTTSARKEDTFTITSPDDTNPPPPPP